MPALRRDRFARRALQFGDGTDLTSFNTGTRLRAYGARPTDSKTANSGRAEYLGYHRSYGRLLCVRGNGCRGDIPPAVLELAPPLP